MPNKKSPANPSGQDNAGADQTDSGSPDAIKDTGGSVPTETLDQLVARRVQGLVDQNIQFLREGRTDKMNPKIVQFLGEYEALAGVGQVGNDDDEEDDDEDSLFAGARRKPVGKPSKLEQIGRKALQQEMYSKFKAAAEEETVAEMWAEDVRAFFAEFQGVQVSPEDPLVQRVAQLDNRKLYPGTRQGWRAWLNDANELRRKYLGRTQASTGSAEEDAGAEDEDATGADADREAAAARKRPPVVTGSGGASGTGLAAVVKATQDRAAGKITDKEFLAILHANRSAR